jgi:hypothetical protein
MCKKKRWPSGARGPVQPAKTLPKLLIWVLLGFFHTTSPMARCCVDVARSDKGILCNIVSCASALPNPPYPILAGTAAASSSFVLPIAALSSGPQMNAGVLGAVVLLHHVHSHHSLADWAVFRTRSFFLAAVVRKDA